MSQPLKKIKLKIHGMHCASCEVLIERKFKKVAGVENVHVSHHNGKAEVLYSKELNLYELNNLVKSDGYHVSLWQNDHNVTQAVAHKNTWKDYFQIGGIVLVIVSAYSILRQFDLVPTIAISEHMSYGVVFLIGLFAAVSTCIAVVGGLLLAVAEKFNESHPELGGIQKFRPHIYFNAGRIAGYTGFGAAVGGLGSVLTLSPQVNGYLTLLVSFVMLLLGFQLLHVFPGLRRFSPKIPKFIGHKIHDLSTKDSKGAPFVLGAATFFLPCGFTQALQLYVLASGDWKIGALTMFVFSLGTLPALISLSAITSFAKGAFQRHVLKFAGVVVVMLAVFNINNGLALTGSNINLASVFNFDDGIAQPSQIVNGKQIVKMSVNGYSYTPSKFTVVQGVPVEWQIDGARAVGCGQVLVMPTLGISKYLSPQGITTITFTPTQTGRIPFNCSMGMMTRGAAFTVVPNITGIVGATIDNTNPTGESSDCNPEITNCIETQKISIEISRARGVYPRSLTVKKGVPVDLTIDSKVPLGGCMSVWVIPEYNVTIPMKVGIIKANFTPTEIGTIAMTCSMGNVMAQINVIN
ncbi:MAG: sulfite exporter TauE/SafE family protein [Candidatus Sungbacteria bacterium]|nr:sulfite exporter TauE/SafE family protein [bacterium]MDZ4260291.1 sulfite exporter TauE/SafE family protein [Candidatus Sungbacteria bacterium]